ncbi:hypothetical protein C8J57DRAFT_1524423 [Mycena rebaudengoi]|nr:hypothetical protein C8J57DRAFT_1524423 [Mycena rebaudengoi]
MPDHHDLHYTALQNDEEEEPSGESDRHNQSAHRTPSNRRGFLVCLGVILVNVALVLFSIHVDRELLRESVIDVATLPTPDPYVGLPTAKAHLPEAA